MRPIVRPPEVSGTIVYPSATRSASVPRSALHAPGWRPCRDVAHLGRDRARADAASPGRSPQARRVAGQLPAVGGRHRQRRRGGRDGRRRRRRRRVVRERGGERERAAPETGEADQRSRRRARATPAAAAARAAAAWTRVMTRVGAPASPRPGRAPSRPTSAAAARRAVAGLLRQAARP